MKNKGVLFTIDGLIALLFVSMLIIILNTPVVDNTKESEKILINNRISDLLITSQILEIENPCEIENNFKKLFENKKGYILLNNEKIEINKEYKKYRKISKNIKYINSSNKEIYIEIGVYY